MHLRSLTKHIKDQNWFAVTLDFFIVVVGILIAFQITNWSEDRKLSKRKTVLTERLEKSFGVDIWVGSRFSNYYLDVQNNARLVLGNLTGRAPLSDEAFLIAAFRASQFTRVMPSTSNYRELISTGDLRLVEKSNMGSLAQVFYEASNFKETADAGKSSDYRKLYRQIVPIDIQEMTDTACGDRDESVDSVLNGRSHLDYACTIDIPVERLALAANLLRGRKDVVEALRHRVAELSSNIGGLESILNRVRPYRADREIIEQSSRFGPEGE